MSCTTEQYLIAPLSSWKLRGFQCKCLIMIFQISSFCFLAQILSLTTIKRHNGKRVLMISPKTQEGFLSTLEAAYLPRYLRLHNKKLYDHHRFSRPNFISHRDIRWELKQLGRHTRPAMWLACALEKIGYFRIHTLAPTISDQSDHRKKIYANSVYLNSKVATRDPQKSIYIVRTNAVFWHLRGQNAFCFGVKATSITRDRIKT